MRRNIDLEPVYNRLNQALPDVLWKNRKSDSLDPASFTLTPAVQGNHPYAEFGERRNASMFYVDGRNGLVLCNTANNPLVVAVGSFDLMELKLQGHEEGPAIYPVIIQMQGSTKPHMDNRDRRSAVMRAISGFHLEDVFVDLVREVANVGNFPSLGILSAEANPNRHRDGFEIERARRRYDMTAQRLGFNWVVDGMYFRQEIQ